MNNKTCLLDAAACVLNMEYFKNPDHEGAYERAYPATRQALIEQIGHDGSERGFHSQEIQDAIRQHGWLMVRHELCPCMQYPINGKMTVVKIYELEKAPDIFIPKLNRNNGIMVCRWNLVHHALAFQAGSNSAYHVQRDQFIPLEDLDVVQFLEFIRCG